MGAEKTKVGFCVLADKVTKAFRFIAHGMRIKLGLFLLVINVPFGYGGAAIGILLAGALNNHFWLKCGTAAYILSWLMLGSATILLGRDTQKFATNIVRRKWRAWRKMRQGA